MSRPLVFVLSDATGYTAERVVHSALVQFGHDVANLRIFPRTKTREDVLRVIAHATTHHALVAHTLVNPELRALVSDTCAARDVASVDLLGPILTACAAYLDATPRGTPGTTIALDDAYFQRIEAMEFSVAADDGQSPTLLERADIVLVGVSRTSKTPVSALLAGQGKKVANVPLVVGIEPNEVLFSLPYGRVFGLTIDPEKLWEIRSRRVAMLGLVPRGDYADRDAVFTEVRWALNLFRKRGRWPVIDVTRMAVEETAAEILRQHTVAELERGS